MVKKETELDAQIAEWCQVSTTAHPWLVGVFRNITQVGSLPTITAITIISAFLLVQMGKTKAATFWCLAIFTGVVAGLIVKHVVDRARPPLAMQEACLDATGSSFPSAHALAIMITALAMAEAFGTLGLPRTTNLVGGSLLAMTVLLVGVSRFYLRAHWCSDVIAGWLLGAAWYVGISSFKTFIGRD